MNSVIHKYWHLDFRRVVVLVLCFQTACMSTEMTSSEYVRSQQMNQAGSSTLPGADSFKDFLPLDMRLIEDMRRIDMRNQFDMRNQSLTDMKSSEDMRQSLDIRLNQDLSLNPNQDALLFDGMMANDQSQSDQGPASDFLILDQSQTAIDMILVCIPQVEVCNGIDDDCNGLIDENIQNVGSWSDCGYENICAQNGTSTRSVETCVNGSMNVSIESQACQRSTEGMIISQGAWSACDYQSTCDERAQKHRNVEVCRNGSQATERETQGCSRNQDGTVVSYGAWSSCSGYSGTCDESGTKQRVNTVCSNGGTTTNTQESACTRNTDNTNCGTNRCCWNGTCMIPACNF